MVVQEADQGDQRAGCQESRHGSRFQNAPEAGCRDHTKRHDNRHAPSPRRRFQMRAALVGHVEEVAPQRIAPVIAQNIQ